LDKVKEAYLCTDDKEGKDSDFVTSFWSKLDKTTPVDVSKPTDRWDWCGLYFGDDQQPNDKEIALLDEKRFVSTPSVRFPTLDDLLNHERILPPNLAA
jgi:hypothetical protein